MTIPINTNKSAKFATTQIKDMIDHVEKRASAMADGSKWLTDSVAIEARINRRLKTVTIYTAKDNLHGSRADYRYDGSDGQYHIDVDHLVNFDLYDDEKPEDMQSEEWQDHYYGAQDAREREIIGRAADDFCDFLAKELPAEAKEAGLKKEDPENWQGSPPYHTRHPSHADGDRFWIIA